MSYVLIVDDDAAMAQTMADMVGLFDWKTVIVHGPRAAMVAIQRTPPALILLDLNMPGVDGMEVCRFIKRDPIAEKTMVVFVTAEDDPSIQQRAREAGASDYLIKPVDVDRLEGILDKLSKSTLKAAVGQPEKPATAKPTSQPAQADEAAKTGPADKPEQTKPEQTNKPDKPDTT
ncbi:MAG: response regulator [Anaerolineae bacterium]|nr:response regulator [Anaerolineae bacterium]